MQRRRLRRARNNCAVLCLFKSVTRCSTLRCRAVPHDTGCNMLQYAECCTIPRRTTYVNIVYKTSITHDVTAGPGRTQTGWRFMQNGRQLATPSCGPGPTPSGNVSKTPSATLRPPGRQCTTSYTADFVRCTPTASARRPTLRTSSGVHRQPVSDAGQRLQPVLHRQAGTHPPVDHCLSAAVQRTRI